MKNFLRGILGSAGSDAEIREEVNAEIDEYEALMSQYKAQQEIIQQHEEEAAGPSLKADPGCALVIFRIDPEGNVGIQLNWNSPTENLANNLGMMMYYMNKGNFAEHCANSLAQTIQKDPRQTVFVKKIMEKWKNMRDENEQVVRPSEVFQMGRQSTRTGQSEGPK